MSDMTVEQVAAEIVKIVEDADGKKNLKPGDLIKLMKRQYGLDKKKAKAVIRYAVESGELKYSYSGGSWLVPGDKQDKAAL